MRDFVASRPDVITTGVSIFHPQLRDLLQPAGEKGKVLFVHRMGIECADFTTMKVSGGTFTQKGGHLMLIRLNRAFGRPPLVRLVSGLFDYLYEAD